MYNDQSNYDYWVYECVFDEYYCSDNYDFFAYYERTYINDGNTIRNLWIAMIVMFLLTCASQAYIIKVTYRDVKNKVSFE